MREVLEVLRQLVLDTAPGLRESIKWGNPCYSYKGNICYLSAERSHVKLGFFTGGHLADPEGLLEGTGKKMRHIKVRSVSDIRRNAFLDLIKDAVTLDRTEGE